MLPLFTEVDGAMIANRVKLHRTAKSVRTPKPFITLKIRGTGGASVIAPFLLDTGSDITLLPQPLYSSIVSKSGSADRGEDSFDVSTIRGSIKAVLRKIDVRFPVLDPREDQPGAYHSLEAGIVNFSSAKTIEWKVFFSAVKSLVVRRNIAAGAELASSVKDFQRGKIGILAARDFQAMAEYYIAEERLFVAKKGTIKILADKLKQNDAT